MRLIAILICLAIAIFTPLNSKIREYSCAHPYLKFIQSKISLSNTWLMISILFIAPLCVFLFFDLWLNNYLYGLIGLIIDMAVLSFCLGPYGFSDQEKSISALFARANENIFAVLIWFIFLGPVGALGYRFITSFRRITESDPAFAQYSNHIQFIHALLDWVPIRVTTLLYALAGDFVDCFSFWISHVWRGIEGNQELLCHGGTIALNGAENSSDTSSKGTVQSAQALIDRAVVISLVLVAIFTLGSWIA